MTNQGAPGEAPVSVPSYHKSVHAAFKHGEPLDFSQGDPQGWIKTIDELLTVGRVEIARFALERLRQQAPDLEWPETIIELIDLMPEGSALEPRFRDDKDSDLQVVAREGARTVVLAFCGRRNRLNMPLWLFQRWMGKLAVSVVYLRDFDEAFYLGGVRSLGSFAATVSRLRQAIDALKAERVVCLGNSSGGYGALRYGIELEAARVFAFSGAVNMTPEFNTFLNRNAAALRLAEMFPDARLDLRELYLAAARPPAVELYHGAKSWDDRIQNEHMAGLAGVVLEAVPGYAGHGTLPELIRRRQFDPILARIESPDRPG